MKKTLAAILIFLASATAFAQYDRDVFFLRGRTALQDGKYALAIENFNILARLDTADYWNFFFRGIAKYNLGDIRGARQDFDRSVRINPVFTNGYHYRAITESRQGDYDTALKDLERAIELRPGFTGLYYSRGVTYFLARRFDAAVEDFDRFIRKDPSEPGAYLNRGAAHLFLQDTTKALKDYNRAIELDRFEPESYIRRGHLYAAQNRYGDALADMNRAIEIDSTNTLAYFNRALLYYETKDYNASMADLNRVLKDEPGNALTLYNRSLINAQMGDFSSALEDIDRVININPGNVLAYFNRASFFAEMGRWQDALADYNKAIELYPDFAKAYMNRAYVENMLGLTRASKADYQTAKRKVAEYRSKSERGEASFADTTRKYSSLLALDADFAKKDFDDELLQHRDIDIRLKPLYKFRLARRGENSGAALSRRYENPLIEHFEASVPVDVVVSNSDTLRGIQFARSLGSILSGDRAEGAGKTSLGLSEVSFLKGIYDVQNKQYSSALQHFDNAVRQAADPDEADRYSRFYRAFYLMNRGVLKAEMIDFIASMESQVQTLTLDDQGATRARLSDRVDRSYDYSEALSDMKEALEILPDIPYLHFNLGNLYCLSSQLVSAIESYDQAIRLYPYMGDAYYNRGLVLIYLKDKEKGCIDLSRAGELGVGESYSVISKYCESDGAKQ